MELVFELEALLGFFNTTARNRIVLATQLGAVLGFKQKGASDTLETFEMP